MKKRASLLAVIALVGVLGCLDTAEPTGPIPDPAPEDPGELAPSEGQALGTSTSATSRRDRRS
jgi:hypothetical protein